MQNLILGQLQVEFIHQIITKWEKSSYDSVLKIFKNIFIYLFLWYWSLNSGPSP
jgi:hypothetical protein